MENLSSESLLRKDAIGLDIQSAAISGVTSDDFIIERRKSDI